MTFLSPASSAGQALAHTFAMDFLHTYPHGYAFVFGYWFNMITFYHMWITQRRLSLHKFMPMSGVHKALNPTRQAQNWEHAGGLLSCYEELNKITQQLDINPRDFEYDVLYVNGDHSIPNQTTLTEEEGGATLALKLRQIEEVFMERMFSVEDV